MMLFIDHMGFRVRIPHNKVVIMSHWQGLVELIGAIKVGTYRVQDVKLTFFLLGWADLSVLRRIFQPTLIC